MAPSERRDHGHRDVDRPEGNIGGVRVSYFERVQDENHLFWDENDVNMRLEKVITRAFNDVLKIHLERKANMRLAANMLGVNRVAEACKIRGLYP
jgi:glutamate dehydrogenase/leucine dehydrogenase